MRAKKLHMLKDLNKRMLQLKKFVQGLLYSLDQDLHSILSEPKAYQEAEAASPTVEGCSARRKTARHHGARQVHLGPPTSYQRGQVSPLQVGSEDKSGSNLPCGQAHLLAAQQRLP